MGNRRLPNAPTGDSRSSNPHAHSQRHALLEAHCCPCPAAGLTPRPTHVAPRSARPWAGSGGAELWVRSTGAGQSSASAVPSTALRHHQCRRVYRQVLEANVLFANRPPPSAAAPPKDNNRVLSAGCEGQPPGEHHIPEGGQRGRDGSLENNFRATVKGFYLELRVHCASSVEMRPLGRGRLGLGSGEPGRGGGGGEILKPKSGRLKKHRGQKKTERLKRSGKLEQRWGLRKEVKTKKSKGWPRDCERRPRGAARCHPQANGRAGTWKAWAPEPMSELGVQLKGPPIWLCPEPQELCTTARRQWYIQEVSLWSVLAQSLTHSPAAKAAQHCTVASFQAGCPSVKAKIQNFLEKTDRIGATPLQAPSTQCIQWGSAWSGGGSGTAASPTWCSWDGHTKVALWVWHLWTKCTPKTKTPHVSSLSQSCSIRNVPTLLGLAALSPQPSTALGSGAAPASPREHPKEERSVQCGASIVGTAR